VTARAGTNGWNWTPNEPECYMRHDDCLANAELREVCRRRYREAVRRMRPGDRVRYYGWRGDAGEGTVVTNNGDRLFVKRDFSADEGQWFFPMGDSRLEPL